MIWKTDFTLEGLTTSGKHSMSGLLGIEFTGWGPDYLEARMPVDERTVQPFRILHGGASAALAETVGSVASLLCLDDPARQAAVGVELNISHLRSAPEGEYVQATVRPARVGRRLHVWTIETRDARERLISVSRLTMAVIDRTNPAD